ncbi:hypothetical protein FRC04_006277 [Tulasnella sp. 424]|nr:hypothetical protein FRC04_006277 [Tulasnella sp. 424]
MIWHISVQKYMQLEGLLAVREWSSPSAHDFSPSRMQTPSFSTIGKAVSILLGREDYGAETTGSADQEISIKAQITVLETAIKVLRKKNNAQAPVHQLPLELFSTIIFHSLPGEQVVMRVLELERVSTYWWDHIRSSPQLWAFAEPGRFLALALKRSGNVPLEVLHPSVWRTAEEAEEFAYCAGEHSHRWRVIRYSGPYLSCLAPYLENALPLIETIELGSPILDPHPISIVAGPRLRHFTVHQVNTTLPALHPSLSNLQTLRIDYPSNHTTPWTDIRDVLVLCSSLEELHLSGLGTSNDADLEYSGDPIVLRRLKTMDLEAVGDSVLSPLVQAVRAPLLETCFMDVQGTSQPVIPRLQGVDSLLSTVIRNQLSQNLNLEIISKRNTFQLHLATRIQGHKEILSLAGPGGDWRRVVGGRGDVHSFIAEHRIPMGLQLQVGLLGDCTFLTALPTLTSLDIIGPYEVGDPPRVVESLFRFLGKSSSGQKETRQLPCPRLAMLEIEGDISLYKAAASLLKTRQALANSGGTRDHVLRIRLCGVEVFA